MTSPRIIKLPPWEEISYEPTDPIEEIINKQEPYSADSFRSIFAAALTEAALEGHKAALNHEPAPEYRP